MKYVDYKEQRTQGSFNFPVGFYRETPFSPRYEMQYHWHTYFEIVRVVSGNFHIVLNSQTRECHAGDIIFIADGVLHGGKPENCVYECVVFDLQFFIKDSLSCPKYVHDLLNHKVTVDPWLSDRSAAIREIVPALCDVLASRTDGYEIMTQGYLYLILGIIFREKLFVESQGNSSSTERLKSIKDVLAYISDNYSNNVSLDELARIAGMNPKYFCRYFRAMTERTPIDYLNYYRIECACEMLSTQNITVKEAAISCGYNDESYFIKTFHKYKGITPKQYLKSQFE